MNTTIARWSLLILLLAAAAGAGVWWFSHGSPALGNETETPDNAVVEDEAAISVKTVQPRLGKSLHMTVDRPADVHAYFSVNIEARVAGQVLPFKVAKGSQVEKDQVLLRLDRPDLMATVEEKGSIIRQRQEEKKLDEQKVKAAEAAVKTAKANLKEKETLFDEAIATTKLREQQFKRLDDLWRRNSLDKNARDEAARNLDVSRAAEKSALAARTKAEAEVEDAQVNVKVTEAEVKRCAELINVARAEQKKAQADLDYATVKAPFTGTITDRKVDPGSFVQNASTGHPTPVLTLVRSDIVTVVMRVPDNFAPFVTTGTEAIFEPDNNPNIRIRGKVTRISKSLMTASRDRTEAVEMDLWNGSRADYGKFMADPKNLVDLKEGPLPIMPAITGKDILDRSRRLLPGSYGKMTLILKTFSDVYLIPSQALVRQGGRTYLYVVESGKAQRRLVDTVVDDGELAKVVLLDKDNKLVGDLTGKEEIVVTNQDELSDTRPTAVTTAPLEDWSSLVKKKGK
jgi:HlyD family secretion protein